MAKRKLTPQATWTAFVNGEDSWTWDQICADDKGWNEHQDKLYRTFWFVSRGYIGKRRYKNRK